MKIDVTEAFVGIQPTFNCFIKLPPFFFENSFIMNSRMSGYFDSLLSHEAMMSLSLSRQLGLQLDVVQFAIGCGDLSKNTFISYIKVGKCVI